MSRRKYTWVIRAEFNGISEDGIQRYLKGIDRKITGNTIFWTVNLTEARKFYGRAEAESFLREEKIHRKACVVTVKGEREAEDAEGPESVSDHAGE